jgi:hypothetical protein
VLIRRNLEFITIRPAVAYPVEMVLHGLPLITGWARVEGNKHYPVDILFSSALGNFIGAFINDAFLGRHADNAGCQVKIGRSASYISLYIKF